MTEGWRSITVGDCMRGAKSSFQSESFDSCRSKGAGAAAVAPAAASEEAAAVAASMEVGEAAAAAADEPVSVHE